MGLRADNAIIYNFTPTEIEMIAFPQTYFAYHQEYLQNWDGIITNFQFKCVYKCIFVYMVATPMLTFQEEML